MKLTDTLNTTKALSSLSLFNAKTIRAVEAGLLCCVNSASTVV